MNGQKLKFMPADPSSAPEKEPIRRTEKSNIGRALRVSASTKATKLSMAAATIARPVEPVKPKSEPCVM